MTGHVAHRVLRRCRDSAGNTMLEAALITPLLLLLTLSIIDFGAMFYVYLSLENGASQATRDGITGQLRETPARPGTMLARGPSIRLAMRQATPTLTIDDSAFAFSNMPVGGSAFVAGTGGPGAVEKLTVTYTWKFFNPMMALFFPGGQILLTVDSTMKNEAVFAP
jgi:Flp pilus assembly protein TadG